MVLVTVLVINCNTLKNLGGKLLRENNLNVNKNVPLPSGNFHIKKKINTNVSILNSVELLHLKILYKNFKGNQGALFRFY